MDTINELVDRIDDIKKKLPDQTYIAILNLLMQKRETMKRRSRSKMFLVTYHELNVNETGRDENSYNMSVKIGKAKKVLCTCKRIPDPNICDPDHPDFVEGCEYDLTEWTIVPQPRDYPLLEERRNVPEETQLFFQKHSSHFSEEENEDGIIESVEEEDRYNVHVNCPKIIISSIKYKPDL